MDGIDGAQSTVECGEEENIDALCDKIRKMKLELTPKHQEKLLRLYNESNRRNRMLILLSSLVNKHEELERNLLSMDRKLQECNICDSNVDDIKYVIDKLFVSNSELQLNQLFIYMTHNKKHWITLFTELLCTLVLLDRQHLSEPISSHPTAPYVWPTVLSMLWDQHNTHPDIFKLSHDLLQKCSLCPHLFSQVEGALHRVESFLDWMQGLQIFHRRTLESAQVLEVFSKHSVLYVINEYLDLHIDNIDLIRQYIIDNTEPDSWQVCLFDTYCVLYRIARLLRESYRMNSEEIAKQLPNLLKSVDYVRSQDSRLQIAESVFSLFFLTQEDFKENANTISNEADIVLDIENNMKNSTEQLVKNDFFADKCDLNNEKFVVNNLDKLKVLTSTLQSYMSFDQNGEMTGSSSVDEPRIQRLQNSLDDISWRASNIEHLKTKSPKTKNLGDELYGKPKSYFDIAKAEKCPMRLLLSSHEDFATYCAMKEDLERAEKVVKVRNKWLFK
ncbi:hypothetical protein M8J77_019340 [Diaphorina citri]|nr:hypothetical protein M8J77_019340 [Diaphorina citri]